MWVVHVLFHTYLIQQRALFFRLALSITQIDRSNSEHNIAELEFRHSSEALQLAPSNAGRRTSGAGRCRGREAGAAARHVSPGECEEQCDHSGAQVSLQSAQYNGTELQLHHNVEI